MNVRRAVVCLGSAFAAHVAIAMLLANARAPRRSVEARGGVETEIDLIASEESAPEIAPSAEATSAPGESAPAATTTSAGAASSANVKVNSLSLSGDGSGAGAGSPAEATPPSSSATTAVQLFAAAPADLGIAGSSGGNPFLPKRDDAPPAAADGKNALRDAFRAHDTMLGMGPEGPAVSAVRDAAYASASPVDGRAIFEVHAGEGGVITLVDVVSAEGGSWSDAQRVAQERLASVKLVLPRGAKAAVFRIEVTSKWAMPAATGFGTRPAEGENGPSLTLPDPSNLGAKPRRVVRARVEAARIE